MGGRARGLGRRYHQPRRHRGALGRSGRSKPRIGVQGHGEGTDDGVVRVLLEGKFAFDVVDLESDYTPYKLLILPDDIPVDKKLKAKIEKYAPRAAARCC